VAKGRTTWWGISDEGKNNGDRDSRPSLLVFLNGEGPTSLPAAMWFLARGNSPVVGEPRYSFSPLGLALL
jgi:hypothetical protein